MPGTTPHKPPSRWTTAVAAVAAHSTAPARKPTPAPHSHPPPSCTPLPPPENLLCCLRFIINPSFCPSLSSVRSLATSTNPSTRAVYLGARARETGAGILNSKYLSRRRGTGRRPDKQVERVQACMERLGWEIAKKANVKDISLNVNNF